jgi:3-dehydroquinate synthase
MGGGATTDLVAFIASTYMRGIPLVLIPTTLLGMVDASIGGKTGVDTPFGKNLIGTFYLPKAIFIEPELLKSLPEKEMKNGLSEILKYGLIEDASIWEKCARWKEEIFFLVHSSISCKVKIVGQDFEEKTGLRRILNFGHTVGHALELLSHYEMAHGEAVALGCMAESYLSHLLGYLSAHELEKILSLYRKLGYAFKKFALSMDKKGKEGSFRFVLIDRIGHCVPFDGEYCRDVPRKELDQLIEWMKHG